MNIVKSKEFYIKINSYKKIKISELMYILSLSVYLVNVMLDTTMFRIYINYKLMTLINIIVSFIILLKIIMFDKYSLNNFILILTLFIFSSLAYLESGYENLFYLPIFIIGAKNIEFRKICKTYLVIGLLIVITSMIAVKLNIIEHIIYFRDDKIRYSFGSVYATDFAARMFFLTATYCYIRNQKLNIIDSILFIMLGIFIIYFCDARLDSISIFMLSTLPFISNLINNKKIYIGKVKRKLLILTIPIMAMISIVLTYVYNPDNLIFTYLNRVLSNRLKLGKRGIEEYGLSLFGQVVEMRGFGASNGQVEDYFFIDNSYLYIALRYGVVLLLIICIYYSLFIKYRVDNKDLLLPIIIILIGINSMIAHHFIDIAYNPFILALFSNMYDMKNKV